MTEYELLSKVTDPADLHKFSDKELQQLADELRQAILDRVSKVGGHFSSNLGTVELTVAMYAAYKVPPDVVVWDTGHQAYPHKMLTGRLDRFDTLRQYKGISGFLKRDEHPLDYFGAGHAGTAISAALGFAAARDQKGTSERVIAVAGDAAICSGMSLEALNHAGDLQTNVTVVLNDNRMSIAPNVGAMTSYFTRLRSRPLVQSLAHRAKTVVEKMPGPVNRVAAGLRHGLTHYFAPENTGTIFEEMGFEYIGPLDGHNLPVLLEIFRNLRDVDGPLFVHAITNKGQGYKVATEDARKWHAVVPFDLASEEMKKKSGAQTYTQSFSDACVEVAERDERVVAITAAMPDGTGLTEFHKRFPARYYDVGIAEQHAVTFAAGLAAGGLKPFCAIYSTFLQRGFDQVLHDVCIQHLPVRFFLDRAGLVGDDGPTHHGAFDISFLSFIPNMAILAPRDTEEMAEMTRFMAGYDQGPIAVRYPRGSGPINLPEHRTPIELGKAEVLAEGDDVTLVALGSMVEVAWDARTLLAKLGLSAGVINARWAKPIDSQTICAAAAHCGALVTIEENSQPGGFGERVRAALHEAGLGGVRSETIALPDQFVEHGSVPLLRRDCGLDPETVCAKAAALVGASTARRAAGR